MLLYWLSYTFGLFVVCLAVICSIIEIKLYCRVNHYKKQGFGSVYVPGIGGELATFMKSGDDNEYKAMSDILEASKRRGEPGVVFNSSHHNCVIIYPMDLDLIKHIFLREIDVLQRIHVADLKLNLGFFFVAGHKGLERRASMAEFFKIDHLNSFIRPVEHLLSASLSKIPLSSEGLLGLDDSDRFLSDFMTEVSEFLLFGDHDKPALLENGTSICQELMAIIDLVFSKVLLNPLNSLLRDWPNKLNLLPSAREASKRSDAVMKSLRSYLEMRTVDKVTSSKQAAVAKSFVDVLIDHNCQAPPERKLTVDDMVGDCIGFLMVALDTTKASLIGILHVLATKQGIQQRVREELVDIDLFNKHGCLDDFEQARFFSAVLLESTRVYPPSLDTFEKLVVKTCKIGNYTFYKGDRIDLPLGPLMWDSSEFKSGTDFDLDSITKANKRLVMPFSNGRRNCIGQSLAQLIVKLSVVHLMSRFEILPKHQNDQCRMSIGLATVMTGFQVMFKAHSPAPRQNVSINF